MTTPEREGTARVVRQELDLVMTRLAERLDALEDRQEDEEAARPPLDPKKTRLGVAAFLEEADPKKTRLGLAAFLALEEEEEAEGR